MPSKTGITIGISYVGTKVNQLQGTVGDSQNMSAFMTNYGYSMTNLNDKQYGKTHSLYPSKANIVYWITKMLRDAKNGDELFIGYAGHGTQLAFNKNNKEEVDGKDEAIIPADYNFTNQSMLIDDEIQILLNTNLISKPNCKVFMLFDCCHSGTVADLRYTYNYSGPTADFVFVDSKIDSAFKAKTILLSGCKDEEVSWENLINLSGGGKSRQGVMTSAFINVVSRNPASLQNVFQIVKEMYTFTKPYKQQPQISCNYDIAKETNASLRSVIQYDTVQNASIRPKTKTNVGTISRNNNLINNNISQDSYVDTSINPPMNLNPNPRPNFGAAAKNSRISINYEAYNYRTSTVPIKNTSKRKIPNMSDIIGMTL